MRSVFLAMAMILALPGAAAANDSVAELGTGGITLARSDVVSMDSEDLFISLDAIEVAYRFTNHGDDDVDTLVAFPMPDLVAAYEENIAIPEGTDDNFLDFTVEADGQAIEPNLQQRALAGGLDVTADLVANGIPLFQWSAGVVEALSALPDDVVADFSARGIVREERWDDGAGMKSHVVPAWTLSSAYWWRMVFPAGQAIEVRHRYKPSIGGTAGSIFAGGVDKDLLRRAGYLDRYCIDDAFLRAVERKLAAGEGYLLEERISYVLRSGANWAGSIGRFHLTVDKSAPDFLVSFCGQGVEKTGPTTFEMVFEDFYPERDLDFLFIAPADN